LRIGERRTVTRYLRYHHGAAITERSSFDDIIPYVPEVLKKIASRLDGYLDDLETDRDLLAAPC
jgi:hypothetical protein